MKIVLDTNIILDVLARREPFFERSQGVMQLVAEGKVAGAITANSVTDIYYILRKHLDRETLRSALYGLMELLEVLSVTHDECRAALDLPMNGDEDALLACCAANWEADYIVTRDIGDFAHSPIEPITPEDFRNRIDRMH